LREADTTRLTDSPAYIRILTDLMPSAREQLTSLMATHRLQALVFSTLSCPATPRFDRADLSYLCNSEDPYKASYLAAAAGFPEITVPAGMISGDMPVGISFMSLPFTEARLLSLANAFQIARPRLPPPALP
jgi:amidase